jgi:hypothetical protein
MSEKPSEAESVHDSHQAVAGRHPDKCRRRIEIPDLELWQR